MKRAHKITAGLALALVTLVVIGVISYRSTVRLVETAGWVAHTHLVQEKLASMLARLAEAESSARGYVLSGDPAFLESHEAAVRSIRQNLHEVGTLTANNWQQQQSLNSLQPLVEQRLAHLNQAIGSRRAPGFQESERLVREGRLLMEDIRKRLTDMEGEEHRLLEERNAAASGMARQAIFLLLSGSVISFALLLAVGYLLRREMAERQSAEKQAQRSAFYGRSLIEASPDPLVTISQSGCIMDVNQATELATGITREHLIGSDFCDYFSEPEKARYGYEQVFARGFVQDYPLAIRHVCGSLTQVLYNATVYRNEAGEVEGIFAAARDVTERKRAEAELRKSCVYARCLIEASLDPLVTISKEGRIMDVNQASEAATGVPRERLIGSDFSDYFTEPDKARQGYEQVFAAGSVQDYPLAIRHVCGKLTEVLYNATVYRNEAGEIEGVFAAARDITERKRAEVELRHSEERYRALVAASQIVWTTNAQGEANDIPSWSAFTGQSEKEVRGWGWLTAIHPQDRERTKSIWQQALESHSLYETEYRVRRQDGEYRHFAVRGVPVLERDGSIREWIGACTDITERKHAEKELQAERQRFRDVLDILPAYVILLTPDYRVSFTNRFFEERFGEAQGRRCYEYLFGVNAPCENCETFKVLKDMAPHQWNWVGPDGHDYEVFDFPFTDSDGSRLILETGLDVTERKRAEEEIRRMNAELESRVTARTAELAATVQELEAFTYSVSHDLRSPLRQISGFAKILTEEYQGILPPEARDYLQWVQDGARRMGRLVDDLLNLSRVGRLEMRPQLTRLDVLVREVLAELEPDARGRDIEWRIADLPLVECDPALMKQVWSNLLSNALKFSRPRQRAIIEIGRQEKDGHLVLFVRDNGVGFSMKYVDKLFGVFQRLHREEDFEGTGVGLATVQRILHKHGGGIWAEAEIDQGACFYFTLGQPEGKPSPHAGEGMEEPLYAVK